MKSSSNIIQPARSQKKSTLQMPGDLPVHNSRGTKSNIREKQKNVHDNKNDQLTTRDLIYLRIKADEDRPE